MNALHPTFPAQVFHPDFGSGMINGQIRCQGSALHFEAGEMAVNIPLDRLRVDLGTEGDERVYFSDPRQPGLRIITPDAALLEWRDSPQVARIRERLSACLTRREIHRRLRLVLWVLGVCALVAWLGMLATGAMVRAIVARAAPEWEQQLGNAALEDLRAEMSFVNDTNAVARLTATAKPLLQTLPGGEAAYQFHIVEDEDPNAFALPGGHIVVTTGELKLASRPEELLGTIAHEVAHVTQQHALRSLVSSGGPFLVTQVFLSGRNSALGALGGASAFLVGQSFSQEYEMEADDVGWRYLVAASIDPRGMIENFRKTLAWEKQQRPSWPAPRAFSTHPSLEKRITRLEKKWRKLPDKARFTGTSESPTGM